MPGATGGSPSARSRRSSPSASRRRCRTQKLTLGQELRSFFAGAKAQGVAAVEAGPWGGKPSCGTLAGAEPRPPACAWTDSETFGSVLLAGDGDLAEDAGTALAFRAAAEERG